MLLIFSLIGRWRHKTIVSPNDCVTKRYDCVAHKSRRLVLLVRPKLRIKIWNILLKFEEVLKGNRVPEPWSRGYRRRHKYKSSLVRMHFHEKVIGKDSKQKLLQDCNNYLCKAYKDVFHLSFVEMYLFLIFENCQSTSICYTLWQLIRTKLPITS